MMRRTLYVLLVLLVGVAFVSGCASDAADTEETAADQAQETDSTTEEPSGGDDEATEFALSTTAYQDDGQIPAEYCNTGVDGGENVSVPLAWEGAPQGASSFAIIMVDRHEVANEWVHWMVVDVPPTTTSLAEGVSGLLPDGARELLSTNGEMGYQGPQPPPGSGDHEYETLLFALDVESVDVAEDATFGEFLDVMDAHHMGEASVSGYFGR